MNNQFELNFSDQTIAESEGDYDTVVNIMKEDGATIEQEWMIKTNLTMINQSGCASFELNFWSTKDIYIAGYSPSQKEVLYNLDLQCLTYWASQNGWNIPKVSTDLVKDAFDYWKYFWTTSIIDSPYLDKVLGDRNNVSLGFDEGVKKQREDASP